MTKESRNNVVGSSKRVRRATDPLLAKEKIKEEVEKKIIKKHFNFKSKKWHILEKVYIQLAIEDAIEETAKEIFEEEKLLIDDFLDDLKKKNISIEDCLNGLITHLELRRKKWLRK